MPEWLNERMETLPGNEGVYSLLCFVLFRRKRKFTYKEWYMLLYKLNEKYDYGNKFAFKRILEIYEANNGKLPSGLSEI